MENARTRQNRLEMGARVDSLQNRGLLIISALELIREKGSEFSMAEVAQRAKVSRMTLYRNFPDKDALVTAVFYHNLENLSKLALDLADDELAFYKLLDIVLRQRIEYNNLEQFIKGDDFIKTKEILFTIFRKPVTAAKNAQVLRADFEVENDLIFLIAMIGGASPLLNMPEFKNTERFLDLLLNGVKR